MTASNPDRRSRPLAYPTRALFFAISFSTIVLAVFPAHADRNARPLATVSPQAVADQNVNDLFDWAERTYPNIFPGRAVNQLAAPYWFRFYPSTGNYVGVDGQKVYVLGPVSGGALTQVGTLTDFRCQVRPSDCVAGTVSRLSGGNGYTLATHGEGYVVVLGNAMQGGPVDTIGGSVAGRIRGLSGIVSVAASSGNGDAGTPFNTNIALAGDGTLYGWGNDQIGALGVAATRAGGSFINPMPNAAMGKIKQVSLCGNGAVLRITGLKEDGTVTFMPGENTVGVVSAGRVAGLTNVVGLGEHHTGFCEWATAIKADGTVWKLTPSDQPTANGRRFAMTASQVPGLTDITMVSCSRYHCLARKTDGTVWSWGENSGGALGPGAGMGRTLPAKVPALTGIRKVAAGTSVSFAISDSGALYGWGAWNTQVYDADDVKAVPVLLVNASFGVQEVTVGQSPLRHASILFKDGTLWSWGTNANGELGDGNLGFYEQQARKAIGIQLD